MAGGRGRDAFWKHGTLGAKKDANWNHCPKSMGGSITRLKYHIGKIEGHDIIPCDDCPEEATREAITSLNAYEQKKIAKKRTANAMAAPMGDFSSTGSQ